MFKASDFPPSLQLPSSSVSPPSNGEPSFSTQRSPLDQFSSWQPRKGSKTKKVKRNPHSIIRNPFHITFSASHPHLSQWHIWPKSLSVGISGQNLECPKCQSFHLHNALLTQSIDVGLKMEIQSIIFSIHTTLFVPVLSLAEHLVIKKLNCIICTFAWLPASLCLL